MFAALIKVQDEPAGPGVMRVPGGTPSRDSSAPWVSVTASPSCWHACPLTRTEQGTGGGEDRGLSVALGHRCDGLFRGATPHMTHLLLAAAADDARRLLPHRQRQARSASASIASSSSRCRGRAIRRRPIDTHQSRQVFLRGGRRRERAGALLARLRVDLRRVGDDRRSEEREPHVFGVAAISRRRQARAHLVEEARRQERLPGDLDASTIDPADKFIVRRRRRRRGGPLIKLHERGDPATKLDLLILGDGYTAAERGKFERDARRLIGVLFATSPFKERERDINVWGLCRRRRAVGHLAAVAAASISRRRVGATYDAFDSERYILTFENRAFRDLAANAPYDVVEILTNSADLRRRRHLQSVQHGRRRQRVGAVHLRPRVRPSPRGARRRVLHLGRRLSAGRPTASSRGSRTSRRCSIRRDLKWKDLVAPGTPLPTPWPKEEFEQLHAGDPAASAAKIRATNRPEAEMDALFREEMAHDDGAARTRAVRRQGRRVRRRQLRGAGLLPSAGRLHHVHARPGAVLRGLPARIGAILDSHTGR